MDYTAPFEPDKFRGFLADIVGCFIAESYLISEFIWGFSLDNVDTCGLLWGIDEGLKAEAKWFF